MANLTAKQYLDAAERRLGRKLTDKEQRKLAREYAAVEQSVSGMTLHGMLRTGTRRYTCRPPANCRSARRAWDYHMLKGPVVWLQLLDGYWGAERENGEIDELENC